MTYKQSITIADIQMNIVTEEEPAVIEAIAGEIDRRIRDIFLKSQNRCPKIEAALLCAIAYCADKNRLQEDIAELEKELQGVDVEAVLAQLADTKAEKDELVSKLTYTEDQARTMKHGIDIANDQIRLLKEQIEGYEKKLAEADAEKEGLKVQLAEVIAELEDSQIKIEITEEPCDNEEYVEPVVSEAVTEENAEESTEEEVSEAVVAKEAPEADDDAAEESQAAEINDNIADSFELEKKPLRRGGVDKNQISIDSAEADGAEPAEKKADGAVEKEKNKAHKRVRAMFDLITFENV